MVEKEWLQEAEKYQEKLMEMRHYLHRHPETGYDLEETIAFVNKELLAMGYEPRDCGKCGVIALAGGRKEGKVFLLRADMDALMMREEAEVEFKATNGKMHACGHDMHTAMLLGAANLLKKHEAEIEGTVKLMFQPAEEILEGAKDMIEAGVLIDPKVDTALMIHVMAGMPFSEGTAIVCDGGVSAPAADYFTIKIQGKGCHGSMPNTGIDPINIGAHIVIALQEINARELSLSDNAALTLGAICGGNAANVIPDTLELKGTLRAYDDEVRLFLKHRTEEIAKGIAATFRGEAEVIFESGCPTLLNDEELSRDTTRYLKKMLGDGKAFRTGELCERAGNGKNPKTSGSEDFSYVSHKVPSIMLALAAGQPGQGYPYPQHHPKVKFSDDVLAVGSAIYACVAVEWLKEHK